MKVRDTLSDLFQGMIKAELIKIPLVFLLIFFHHRHVNLCQLCGGFINSEQGFLTKCQKYFDSKLDNFEFTLTLS